MEGYIRRGVLPALGSHRLRDVAPAEIGKMIRDYRDEVGKARRAKTSGRSAARALLAACKGLFGYAVACGWIDSSPAEQLTSAIVGPSDGSRVRVLSDEEIRFVMQTEALAGPPLRFLLATGLRIGEAYEGSREGQYWVVPADASKNGKVHRVWLSSLALAQLDHFRWSFRRQWLQTWARENGTGWTCHDLRRTFATRNNDMGVAPHIVEKMLNHSLPGLMATYNRATYDAERWEALEACSAWLQGLTQTQTADVVSIRTASRQAA